MNCNIYGFNFYEDVPVCPGIGYLELNIFEDEGSTPARGATVSFYARQDNEIQIPVKKVVVETNPTIIALPLAHPLGKLIRGHECYFTTYNMEIEKGGFFSIIVKNIRMFPGVTTKFNFHLNRAQPGVPGRQETITIPPHPRDFIN